MKKDLFCLMGTVVLFLFVSCNKDQQTVRKLSGKWRATQSTTTIGGVSTSNSYSEANAPVYDFDNCSLKKDEYCNVTITQPIEILGSSLAFTFKYKVEDDGKTLEINMSSMASMTGGEDMAPSKMNITHLDSKKLTIGSTMDSISTETVFEKVK
jgi:hypothetical protein